MPANGRRDMPDIALDSSCETPVSFYWKGGQGSFCGTSAAAPLFAGMVADLDQAAGRSLGFLNPMLYSVASSDPGAFHDIVSGCSVVRNGSGVSAGYCAGSGWDFVTGLGSIDASRLAKDIVPNIAIPEFPTNALAITAGLGILLAMLVERNARPRGGGVRIEKTTLQDAMSHPSRSIGRRP